LITLYEQSFSKGDLDAVPEVERTLFFILAEIANELTILSKQLIFWLQPVDSEDDVEKFARTSAGLTTARLLAGRIHEAWNVLRAKEHGQVYLLYRSELDADSVAAFATIKKYFGKKDNVVSLLRNKMAFHTDFQIIRDAFADFPRNEELTNFIHKTSGNTFYNSAHLISAFALKGLTRSTDLTQAIERVSHDVVLLSGLVGRYVHGFTAVFSERYITVAHLFSPLKERELNVPKLAEVFTPFYCEAPEEDA
jgi:hypothetical protein